MAPSSIYYAIRYSGHRPSYTHRSADAADHVIKKIQKDVKDMTILTAIQSILLLGLTYVLIGRYGIIGAGWGWVATYALMAAIMAANAKREGWV